ncbi:MAG: hypothetical protein JWO56_3799, partial [Acidobacteria bacterium]|nr:hypothetical protein [Acidobacteriota bacterium]
METTNQTPNTSASTGAAGPAGDPITAVTLALQALEPLSLTPEGIVEYLRALRTQVPAYGQLETHSIALLKNANVDPNFVQATNNVAGVSSVVQQTMGGTPETLNQEAEAARSWSIVEEEVRAFLKGIVNANLVRRHRIGSRALQGYHVAKALAKTPEHSDLLPHVDALVKMNKYSRLRRKVAKTASAGTPTTGTPTTGTPT